jgi:hypothetical protein
MIIFDICSEIMLDNTICFCRFCQITLRAGEGGGKLMFNGFCLCLGVVVFLFGGNGEKSREGQSWKGVGRWKLNFQWFLLICHVCC